MAFGNGTSSAQLFDVASILEACYADKATSSESNHWKEKPVTMLDTHNLVLYVSQRELAVVDPESLGNIQYIASDGATTCHIAVLLHTELQVVGLAHFDDTGLERGVSDLLQLMDARCAVMADKQPGSNNYFPYRYELSLFGGFTDHQGQSHQLSQKLLELFSVSSAVLNLKTVFIGHRNTHTCNSKPYPIVTGIGVDCNTLDIFKAKCQDHSPDIGIRGCRNFVASTEVKCIYNNERKEFVIEPFTFEPYPNIGLWLQQSDKFLLKHMSTSPEQEDDDFVAELRSCLQCMYDHSEEPLLTLFNGGRARRYILSPNGWVLSETSPDPT